MNPTAEHATEFEKAFLLLSDIYIEVGKYDLAAELCKKCIANNKSCAKVNIFSSPIYQAIHLGLN